MKVEKFTEISDKLRNDWEALWNNSTCANIVNSPAWTLAAKKAFNYRDLLIIAIYDDEKKNILAISAFVKEKIFGVSAWTVPAREYVDKRSILASFEDEKIIDLMLSEVLKLGIVYLCCYKLDEALKMYGRATTVNMFKGDVNMYLEFSGGRYGKYPNKKRNNLLNRAEKENVKIKFITTTYSKDMGALETCFMIDKESVKRTKGKGVFHRPEARQFYKTLAELASENVPLSILYLNDKPVSYLIAFMVNGTFTATQKAYLEGFEYFNPGKLMTIKLLDYYCEKRLPIVEFGRGCDRSKHNFTSNYYVLYSLVISNSALLRFYIAIMHDFRLKAYKSLSQHPKCYFFYKKIKEAIAFLFCMKAVCCYYHYAFSGFHSINL